MAPSPALLFGLFFGPTCLMLEARAVAVPAQGRLQCLIPSHASGKATLALPWIHPIIHLFSPPDAAVQFLERVGTDLGLACQKVEVSRAAPGLVPHHCWGSGPLSTSPRVAGGACCCPNALLILPVPLTFVAGCAMISQGPGRVTLAADVPCVCPGRDSGWHRGHPDLRVLLPLNCLWLPSGRGGGMSLSQPLHPPVPPQ